jgi:hypothetical protein
VKSFDFFLGAGMKLAVKGLDVLEFEWEGLNYRLWFDKVTIQKPTPNTATASDSPLLPSEVSVCVCVCVYVEENRYETDDRMSTIAFFWFLMWFLFHPNKQTTTVSSRIGNLWW